MLFEVYREKQRLFYTDHPRCVPYVAFQQQMQKGGLTLKCHGKVIKKPAAKEQLAG